MSGILSSLLPSAAGFGASAIGGAGLGAATSFATSTLSGLMPFSGTSPLPCTYNGVPINVLSYEIKSAPQKKIHNGPNWKYPIVETMGALPTRVIINGFVVGLLGSVERMGLRQMAYSTTAGLLTIPTVGIWNAQIVRFDTKEDTSDMISFEMELIEVNDGLLSGIINGVTDGVTGAMSSVTGAVGDAFSSAGSYVSGGLSSVGSYVTGSIPSTSSITSGFKGIF